MTIQILSLINFGQKIPQFRFILKIFLFSVWVSNSEERKTNLRKPYMNISARLVASSCSISGGAHDLVSCHILSALNLSTHRDTFESLRYPQLVKFVSVLFTLGLVWSGYTGLEDGALIF
jgi:hypothetical protein